MSAELKEVIEKIRSAYEKTRLKPCQMYYFTEDGTGACGASALAIAEGWSRPKEAPWRCLSDLALAIGKPWRWVYGFMEGWDDCGRSPRRYPPGEGDHLEGYNAGWEAFRAVTRG